MSIELNEKEMNFIIRCVKRRLDDLIALIHFSESYPDCIDAEYDFASDLLGALEISLEKHKKGE